MVGLPASGPKSACNPGRVSTPPLPKTTSWQSGETPCGRSAGDISVTSPPKISMGASSDPAVVIFLYEYLYLWYISHAQACFGECSQWGYWARLRNVEGCSAAPGVRVSHSPLSTST